MTDPLGKLMMAVITGLLLWVGQTTQENRERIVAMETNLSHAIADRYTSTQATADRAISSGRLDRIDAQIADLKDRLREVEAR